MYLECVVLTTRQYPPTLRVNGGDWLLVSLCCIQPDAPQILQVVLVRSEVPVVDNGPGAACAHVRYTTTICDDLH